MSIFFSLNIKVDFPLAKVIDLMICNSNLSYNDNIYRHDDLKKATLVCNYFNVTISQDDIGAKLCSRAKNMSMNYDFNFEPYRMESGWERAMFLQINQLINFSEGDVFFTNNGDRPILERKNGRLVVDSRYFSADSQHTYPFDVLTLPFEIDDIEAF